MLRLLLAFSYGPGVEAFFMLFRWMFVNSVVFSLIWALYFTQECASAPRVIRSFAQPAASDLIDRWFPFTSLDTSNRVLSKNEKLSWSTIALGSPQRSFRGSRFSPSSRGRLVYMSQRFCSARSSSSIAPCASGARQAIVLRS